MSSLILVIIRVCGQIWGKTAWLKSKVNRATFSDWASAAGHEGTGIHGINEPAFSLDFRPFSNMTLAFGLYLLSLQHTGLNMEQRCLEAFSWAIKSLRDENSLQDLHGTLLKENIPGKSLSSLTSGNRNDLSAPCSLIPTYLEHFWWGLLGWNSIFGSYFKMTKMKEIWQRWCWLPAPNAGSC